MAPTPNDLQTTQGKEDANGAEAAKATDKAKRDAGDDDVLTEVSLEGSELEVEENNRKGGDTVKTKKKIKRSEKERIKKGKGTGNGSDQKLIPKPTKV